MPTDRFTAMNAPAPGREARAVMELTGDPTPVRALLADVGRHWRLLPMLARQHFRGKYRAASMGLAWSAAQPVMQAAVLTFVFTRVVRIDAGIPYAAFAISGTSTWGYVSQSLTSGAAAITDTSELATRVYFPRLLLAAMPGAANAPTYGITMAIALVVAVLSGLVPGWQLAVLPLVMLAVMLFSGVASAVLALLNVYYRDVKHLVATGVALLFYATPIIYPLQEAGRFRWLIEMNPATGLIQAVRWSLFDGQGDFGTSLWWTAGWTIALGTAAVLGYRRHERVAVDRL